MLVYILIKLHKLTYCFSHLHQHTSICTYMHVYISSTVLKSKYIYTKTHIRSKTQIHKYIHHIPINIYVHIQENYTYIHINVYVRIHMCTNVQIYKKHLYKVNIFTFFFFSVFAARVLPLDPWLVWSRAMGPYHYQSKKRESNTT